MKYAYEDFSDRQFEDLVVALCQFLLGAGVQAFATGVDGGRDAKFVGTAEHLPSKAAPWVGTVIVQAKHTNGYNKSFTDADFVSDKHEGTVLGAELPRIKKLVDAHELDHYLLFSNRKLTGNGESKVRTLISNRCGVSLGSILVCGLEQLEMWLKRFPEAAELASIDPVDSPLIVGPDELADIVERLALSIETMAAAVEKLPSDRVTYEEKNKLNNMTPDYARALRRLYLKETPQIRTFLAEPGNSDIVQKYDAAVEEFQLKIIAHRKDFQTFDKVMLHLLDQLFKRDPVLSANKRLTRAMLFYMYWNCDIGNSDDPAS